MIFIAFIVKYYFDLIDGVKEINLRINRNKIKIQFVYS